MENKKKLSEILFKDNKIVIPEYQREYSWGKEELDVYLMDILKDKEEENDIYFGVIFMYKPKHENKLYLVDGQQRVTTTLLFLNVITNLLEEQMVNKDKIFLYINGENRFYSENEKLNKAYLELFYQNAILEEEELSNEQLLINSIKIKELLKDKNIHELEELYNYIMQKIFISPIIVDDLKESMKIFMKLNARGKELSAIEIIKALLFSYMYSNGATNKENTYFKNKFNDIVYTSESTKYSNNIKELKNNLRLYIIMKNNNAHKRKELQVASADKIFATTYMELLEKEFNLYSYEGMKNYIEEFEDFTKCYIWWNTKMIKSYEQLSRNFLMERKYRDKFKEIEKAKTNSYATLISFSIEDKELAEYMYDKILQIFSVINATKFYYQLILEHRTTKIDLGGIDNKEAEIYKAITTADKEKFKEIVEQKNFKVSKKELEELKSYLQNSNLELEDPKNYEMCRKSIINIKEEFIMEQNV